MISLITGNVELAMTTLAVNEENLKEEALAGMHVFSNLFVSYKLKKLLLQFRKSTSKTKWIFLV